MSDTIPLLPVLAGIDNVHDASHAVFQPKKTAAGWAPPERVRALTDLNLDSDGALTTRPGAVVDRVLTLGRRAVAKGGLLLVQDGVVLSKIDPADALNDAVLLSGLTAPILAHEWPTGGTQVLITDGAINRRIRSGVVSSWGLPVPSAPTVTSIAGTLPAGDYLIALTYRDGSATTNAAQESGAAAPLRYTLAAAGGLRLTATVTDPFVTHVSFYVSPPDQSQVFRAATVAVTGTTVRTAVMDLTTEAQTRVTSTPLLMQGFGPPPLGITALGSLKAFTLVAVGSALYRSMPGVPGLFAYAQAVQTFPVTITTIIGLQDGAWIGTTKGLYWLSGDTPEQWAQTRVTDVPILPEGLLLDGEALPMLKTVAMVALFVAPTGLVVGLPGGHVLPLTQDRYHFSTAARVSLAYSQAMRRVFIAVS